MREQVQRTAQSLQEGAQQVGERLQERYADARDAASRGYHQAENMMAHHPTQSVLIGFGIGFGLGLVLTTLLTRPEESWAERQIPGRLRDRLSHAPDSLHHLADSIRQLPEAIARHLPSSLGRA
jgi:hypothetical protein